MTRIITSIIAVVFFTPWAFLPVFAGEPAGYLLKTQIAQARRENPKIFQELNVLKGRMPMLDGQKHGRLAIVTPILKSLGPAALMPMLEELMNGFSQREMTPSARVAWRVGLIEAVCALRDTRSTDVLRGIMDAENDPDIVLAAAVGVGKLAGGSALEILGPLAGKAGSKQFAAIAGLGNCRTLEAARFLSSLIKKCSDEKTASELAKALGELGSSWVWQTPELSERDDAVEIRRFVAQALLDVFVAGKGDTRSAAETGFLIVDPPDVDSLMKDTKMKASKWDRTELERLASRLAHSPLHSSPGVAP